MSDFPHVYRLFGLTVASERSLRLPLQTGFGSPDVTVRFQSRLIDSLQLLSVVHRRTVGDEELLVHRTDDGWLWEYPDGTKFWIDETASHIVVEQPSHYSVEDVVTYLVGPVFGFLLRLRGVTCLHGSTVVIEGRAVALLGPAGAGKSTLTAQLLRHGARLVSEDVSPIVQVADRFDVLPGFPFVKLWPESADRFGDSRPLTPNWDKRYLDATGQLVDGPVDLQAIFLLRVGEQIGVHAINGRDALVRLVDNVYVSYALTAQMRATDLVLLGDLVDTIPVMALDRSSDLDDLSALANAVELACRSLT